MKTKDKKVPLKKKKKQKGRGYLTIKQIETALRGTGGFVTYAAKQLNCTHQNIKKRINGSPYLQEVMDSIHEGYLDLSEHSLLKKIKSEDLGAICFYLKCKGKSRGYIEKPLDKPQDTAPEQQPQTIKIVMEDARRNPNQG